MRPIQLLAIGMTAGTVPVAVILQYYGLQFLVRVLDRMRRGVVRMLVVVPWIMTVHAIQISLYGVDDLVAEMSDASPGAKGRQVPHGIDAIYFSNETFTSVGYGDYAPTGLLRLVSCIESLNGLLLIGWSVTFIMRARLNSTLMRS